MEKNFQTKLREWIRENVRKYLGVREILYATTAGYGAYVHQGELVSLLLSPRQISERAEKLAKEVNADEWKVQEALLALTCKKLQNYLEALKSRPESPSFCLWAKVAEEPSGTVALRVEVVEYLNPMPTYEISEDVVYQELLAFIKEYQFETFEEFENYVGMNSKPVRIAIESSLTVSGPQVEFQKRFVQKAQEVLSKISSLQVAELLEKDEPGEFYLHP